VAHEVFRDRRLRHLNVDFAQFSVNPRCAHRGLACDMVRIRSRISLGTGGRRVRPRLFHVQNHRTPRRCQASTVAGSTMTSTVLADGGPPELFGARQVGQPLEAGKACAVSGAAGPASLL
jgi:hypothetical protein